jgi:hypothetical protein
LGDPASDGPASLEEDPEPGAGPVIWGRFISISHIRSEGFGALSIKGTEPFLVRVVAEVSVSGTPSSVDIMAVTAGGVLTFCVVMALLLDFTELPLEEEAFEEEIAAEWRLPCAAPLGALFGSSSSELSSDRSL